MQDLNLEADPHFPAFIALLNSVRKNDRVGVQAAASDVQKMEKSAAAFGVALLNAPVDVDLSVVSKLSPLSTVVDFDADYFDAVNYLASRAAVRFAEQNNVEALDIHLPSLEKFKNRFDLDVEEDLYLDIAVEKQYPELLRFVIERQTKKNNFGWLGMVQTALFARKNNDFWALDRLHDLSAELAFPASDWGLVALALYEEGATQWAEEIVKRHQGEAGFDEVIKQQDRQVSTQTFSDVRTMVEF